MSEYGYKLILKVKDHGRRLFAAEGSEDTQNALSTALCFDLDRSFTILNSPPSDSEMIDALGAFKSPLYEAIKAIQEFWDFGCDFDTAIVLEVDLSVLASARTEKEELEFTEMISRRFPNIRCVNGRLAGAGS